MLAVIKETVDFYPTDEYMNMKQSVSAILGKKSVLLKKSLKKNLIEIKIFFSEFFELRETLIFFSNILCLKN